VAVDGQEVSLDLPFIAPGETLGHVVAVPLVLPQPLTGRTVTVTIAAVSEKETDNWYTGSEVVMPVALAEIGISSLVAPPVPDVFDSGCRTDLMAINGQPVGLRVTGDRTTALAGQGLLAVFCDQSLVLPAGDTRVQTVDGRFTGFNIDRVVLRSGVGGAAAGQWSNPAGELSAQVTVTHQGRSKLSAQISQTGESFWLVLGQSFNEGWAASVNGEDLGTPQLVDGFANGWLVNSSEPGELLVEFRWAPQRSVNFGLGVSAAAVLLCLVLAWRGRRFSAASVKAAVPEFLDLRSRKMLSQATSGQVALSMGLVALLVSRPWVGLVVALVSWLSARYPKWRFVPLALATVAYGGGVAYIIFLQIRWGYEPSFAWPSWGRSAHHFGLLAVLLLMADVVVRSLVERVTAKDCL
jgi:arabinofuranan 3-O-arabinosyltransferase